MSGTSQATFNKLQVPTDISEKTLQNPINSAQLSMSKNTRIETRESWHFCIFLYTLPSEVAYMAEALCYNRKVASSNPDEITGFFQFI
jgi:hypothetical protein